MAAIDAHAKTQHQPLTGILIMCLAMLLMPLMNGSAKYLSADYPLAQIVWARYAGHLVFILIMFMPRRGFALFRTANLTSQIGRSFLLLTATILYFTALQYLPLATAAAINFITPFLVIGLAIPLLGEKVGPRRWISVIIGFMGTLVIIRPGSSGLHWSVFLVIGCAISYALFQVMTRKLAHQEDSATTILYTAIVGTVAASLVLPFNWILPDDPADWLAFVSIGLFGGLGHYFAIVAFRYAQASLLSPLLYGQLIGATAFGYFVFGDLPDSMTWIGVAIIIASGIYLAYRENQSKGD